MSFFREETYFLQNLKKSKSTPSIKKPSVELEYNSVVFNNSPKKPLINANFSGASIPSNKYTVEYINNTNAGFATVKVTFNNEYDNAVVNKSFRILPYQVQDSDFELDEQEYTGSPVLPSDIEMFGETLDSSDYTYTISNNISGTAIVNYQFTGNYTGTLTKTFKILSDLFTATINLTDIDGTVYTEYENTESELNYKIIKEATINLTLDGVLHTKKVQLIRKLNFDLGGLK